MKPSLPIIRLFGPAVLMLVAGCAPAYHSYSDCHVNCNYCPPPPLQYSHHEGCECHSCAATPYLAATPIANSPEIDSSAQPNE